MINKEKFNDKANKYLNEEITFNEFYKDLDNLFNTAIRKTISNKKMNSLFYEADDIKQETHIKYFKRLNKDFFNADNHTYNYLYTMAVNKTLDYIRSAINRYKKQEFEHQTSSQYLKNKINNRSEGESLDYEFYNNKN